MCKKKPESDPLKGHGVPFIESHEVLVLPQSHKSVITTGVIKKVATFCKPS